MPYAWKPNEYRGWKVWRDNARANYMATKNGYTIAAGTVSMLKTMIDLNPNPTGKTRAEKAPEGQTPKPVEEPVTAPAQKPITKPAKETVKTSPAPPVIPPPEPEVTPDIDQAADQQREKLDEPEKKPNLLLWGGIAAAGVAAILVMNR